MVKSLPERIPIIAEHAQAIGYVCVLWATMEINLDRLLETVLHLDNADVGDSLTANVDLREKLHALKAVAFIRKPNDSWFASIEELITYIDDTLRPARNRFVHDLWIQSGTDVVRRTRKTVLQKPQAHQPRELIRFIEAPIDPKEIWLLADSIGVAARSALFLRIDYEHFEAERRASQPKSP